MDLSNQGSRSLNVKAKIFDSVDAAILSDGAQQISQEIPFLVTHWLSNFGNSSGTTAITGTEVSQDHQRIAVAKIRRAASELASAFSSLGAYGTTLRVSELHCYFVNQFPFNSFRSVACILIG